MACTASRKARRDGKARIFASSSNLAAARLDLRVNTYVAGPSCLALALAMAARAFLRE